MAEPGYWFEVTTDADFTKEGIYVVTLELATDCSFAIQVISPDYVE